MASLTLSPGDVFWLFGTGGVANPTGGHRMICLAANPADKDYLVAPICTPQPQSDRTCELSPQEYKPLSHRSYVAYHLMRVMGQKALDAAVLGTQFKKQPAMDAATLKRVRDGVSASPEAIPRLQTYLKTHG